MLVLALIPQGARSGVGRSDSPRFVDIDDSPHAPAIEAIADVGVTRGCDPPENTRFCPLEAVTRGQMAAFLVRAFDLAAGPVEFTDTHHSVFVRDIGALASAGITRGCNPPTNTMFCPSQVVTRGQMAAFLRRALGLTDGPDRFVDDEGSVFEADVDALAAAGITAGCNPPRNDRFCPDAPVSRAEMATFLARARYLIPRVRPATCAAFPADDIWNTPIDQLPADERSDAYVATIGADATLHPDFGAGFWPPGSSSPIGIPITVADGATPLAPVAFTAYGDESDPGPYPIPSDAAIEGGTDGDGDRHVIVVERSSCTLYELFDASPDEAGGWVAASGAVFDLKSSGLRPDGWTSADAAGLPIYPGLVRYDEVASGEIAHALRFTAPATRAAHVWPARHHASQSNDPDRPPMGQRFRLEADFDISTFHPDVQVILAAMQRYGIVLADNGSSWFVSGEPDPRWNNETLAELRTVPGSAFEAVDVSGLMVDPDSGQTD